MTLFLLLLTIEKKIESFTVKCLSNRVPAKASYRDLHVLASLGLLVTILNCKVGTVKSNLVECISLLRNRETAKSAPQLNIELKLNLFLFIGLPAIHGLHGLLDHVFVAILDELKVAKNFTSKQVCLGWSYRLLFYDSCATFRLLACRGIFFVSASAEGSKVRDLLGNSCFDGVEGLAQVRWELLDQ